MYSVVTYDDHPCMKLWLYFIMLSIVIRKRKYYAYGIGQYDKPGLDKNKWVFLVSKAWSTVSTIVCLPRMFPPRYFLFEKRIGLVTMGVLYIIFT